MSGKHTKYLKNTCSFGKPKEPEIIAHRGASRQAPENTLMAFNTAWEQSADGIEGDFRLTGDGHVVCIHDEGTGRVAKNGLDLKVEACNLEKLQELDVGIRLGTKFAGEKIPTLEEVLKVLKPAKKIYVEIKSGPEILEPIKRIITGESSVSWNQIVIISFSDEVIRQTRAIMPQVRTLLLTDGSGSLSEVINRIKACGAHGVDIKAKAEVVVEKFVAGLREAGYEFHAWTINEASAARHFRNLGVDSITTDCPASIRRAICKSSSEPGI